MHTTMVPEQVKPQKIQAGVQVSRLEDKDLILRVKKLEHNVKASKSRRRARVIISDNEEDLEDSFKQGRIIAEIDQSPSISLVQDEGTSWIQEDADIQGRNSADTEILLEEPTELVEDFGSGEKGEKEISTANILVSATSAIPEVSTAGVSTAKAELSTLIPEVSTIAENLVYIRMSAEKRKDKGKAIIKEDESIQQKTKKQLEQERLSQEEAIRLQERINEKERQRIARDTEIAKQLQEEINTTRQEQEKSDLEKALELQKQLDEREEVVAEADPAQNLRGYKQSHFKGMSYEDIRPIFERIKEVLGSVEEQSAGKEKEVSKEELKKLLVIVLVEEVYIEALQVKYPIIDWEVFTEESRSYWRIIRVGNHTEVYQVFEDMLKRFDGDDLEKL
ncbi:hypothetical protein Tco_1063181 [Tanacetum coccineum]